MSISLNVSPLTTISCDQNDMDEKKDINELCNTREIMVYGYQHTKYKELGALFTQFYGNKIFPYSIGASKPEGFVTFHGKK